MVLMTGTNDMNDMNSLEIGNLLSDFNDSDSSRKDIRMIENDTKKPLENKKIKLKESYYQKNNKTLVNLELEFIDQLNMLEMYYIPHLKYPNFPEYSNNFFKIKNRLNGIINEINMIENDIQNNINYLNEISKNLNFELDIYKIENKKLEDRFNNLKSTDVTSEGLIDDYTNLYKNQRTYNIGMIITFIIAIFIMRRIFSNNTSNNTNNTNNTNNVVPQS